MRTLDDAYSQLLWQVALWMSISVDVLQNKAQILLGRFNSFVDFRPECAEFQGVSVPGTSRKVPSAGIMIVPNI